MKRLLLLPVLASLACFTEPTVVEPSVAVTLPATDVSGTTATLAGTVNPHGVATEGWFEWSTDPSMAGPTVTPIRAIEPTIDDVALSAALTRLVPDDTYYFRAVASNTRGTVRGSTLSFTTPLPPSTYTHQYQLSGNFSNSVTGGIWPNGSATVAWFEYGTDSTFATFDETPKRPIGSGSERVDVTETLPGLVRTTTYYLRVMASNVGGTTTGNIAWFTTGAPPDLVTSSFYPTANCDSATVYLAAIPNGANTEGWIEYAATPSMSDHIATPRKQLGAGTTRPVWVYVTLPLSSPFYFRGVASNWLGTVRDLVEVASRDVCKTK